MGPISSVPQQLTVPSDRIAQVWENPAAMALALEIPATVTGVDEDFVTAVLPSWPSLLLPQHLIVPSARRAQVCVPPTAMAVAVEIPKAATGVDESLFVPSPS
jgi:hypothetical protein